MTRREALLVAAWLVLVAACGLWLARHLQVTADLAAFLPSGERADQKLLATQLREGVAARLILVGIEGGERDSLTRASRALTAALAKDPRFASVVNGDAARLAAERDLVWRHRYLLSPLTGARHFSTDGLRGALEEALRLITSPMGPAVRETIAADPTGEARAILGAGTAGTGARATHDGIWISADGRRALIVATTVAPGFDVDAQQAAGSAIERAFAELRAGELTLVMSSPGLLAAQSRRIVQRDAQLASSLAGAAVLVLLWLVYRAPWAVGLSALPALSGLAAGVTVVGLAFEEVHALTLGFGALLIGEAVDYPTYLFANNDGSEAVRATATRVGRPLLLACATTAAGATAMLLSGFAGIAQLGTLTMAGVLVAGAVTRWVLPALTPAGALARKRVAPPRIVRAACDRAPRHAHGVLALAALAVALIGANGADLWDDDLANASPVPQRAKALDRELRDESGSPDLRHVVVARAATREEALQAGERVVRRLDDAVRSGAIAGYDHAARYLPSEHAQRARQAALPDRATLSHTLASALDGLPFRADAFAPFLDAVEAARTGPLLRAEDLAGTLFALRLEALLVREATGYAALVPLTGVADPQAVTTALAGEPAVALLDLKAEVDALVAGYRSRALLAALFGAAGIVAMTAIGLSAPWRALQLAVPVACALALTIAALLLLGQRLTLFHLVSLLFVVGVGINYSVFFDFRGTNPQAADLALLSIVVAGAASLIASVALAVAATPALSAIGMTTGLGAVFSFACCASLVRRRSP